jgi:hypothetical protein
VLAIGCSSRPDDGLVLAPGDHKTAIEARYSEGEHAVTLRSTLANGSVVADITDERGHSVSQLAKSILDKPALPVNALMANANELGTAVRLAQHGMRSLRDQLGTDEASSGVTTELSRATAVVRSALTKTRLALLSAWGSEARKHLTMTPDEHAKFFVILNRQATAITGKTKSTTSYETEIAALLGPERFAQYKTRRAAWLAPAGETAVELVP